ncbi:MAG: type II secretion system protein [Gammaproteobacteria bacterium]|nr:type II secretion system protein [Gammaproteobacteria bacterium]
MKKMNSGFTLIELVVVIVILGILGITAVPRFVDLSQEAEQAAVDGLAGALSSGSAINYAACKAGDAACQTIDNCTDAGSVLQAGSLPNDSNGAPYTITASAVADDAAVSCTVQDSTATYSASFTALGT